ncbi:MAG TPA: GTPase HflX [Halothiobacillus sp.]|nr:GTPase HflX [Halothiobacillus sp.]
MQFFERHSGGERVVLVHIDTGREHSIEDEHEFLELARSAGADIVAAVSVTRQNPDPKLFVGSGKAQEIADLVEAHEAELVIFNHSLSPSQERNLERLLKCRVIDRTGLILDIFAQRARSHEGKLQVELAQLKYLSTRLVRGWTHLERQRGGSIGLRGPGETQLEMDRRLINRRIAQLNTRINKVQRQRHEGRKGRQRSEVPTVSLVGYTNAGKSTLFNTVTAAHTYAADKLFATLDTTLRRVKIAPGKPVVLADTVGFIRHLPHDLVTAFRSTLEETLLADLLLQVVDAADPEHVRQLADVDEVLEEIGAKALPRLIVMNKIDRLERSPGLDRDDEGRPWRVWVSAKDGLGIELLQQAITERLQTQTVNKTITLSAGEGRIRSRLIAEGAVVHQLLREDGNWQLEISLPEARWNQLCKHEPLLAAQC